VLNRCEHDDKPQALENARSFLTNVGTVSFSRPVFLQK
jgi:hypothetical protein